MLTTINSLPQEIFDEILENAASLNFKESSTYTYGLCRSLERLHNSKAHVVVRGHLRPDALKWSITYDIRRVGRRWHEWACYYALRNLYIRRWRGSERSVNSLFKAPKYSDVNIKAG